VLYYPYAGPLKSVIRIREWRGDLRRSDYPGEEPFHTGVAVSEEVYEEIVRHAAYFANQIDNRTQRKRARKPNVEEAEDVAGESVIYALSDKHDALEARDQYILRRNSVLNAIHRSIVEQKIHRVGSMEPIRTMPP
jgi:hypothetical protein